MNWSSIIKFIKTYQRDIVFGTILVLIFISAYNIGKIKAREDQKPEITITRQEIQTNVSGITDTQTIITPIPKPAIDWSEVKVIASKNSKSKVYHFPWCGSANKIKEDNKITFANEQAAIAAGYKLAGNCSK